MATEITATVYAAIISYLEQAEREGRLLSNGHHWAQELCKRCKAEFARRGLVEEAREWWEVMTAELARRGLVVERRGKDQQEAVL